MGTPARSSGLVHLDVLGREGAVAEVPAVDDVDTRGLVEAGEQVFRALIDPLERVFHVVERVGGIDDADRLVGGAERGSTLQVDVDVACLHEREAVGVGAELARRIQLDGEADVGFLESLLQQLDAAEVVRRLLVLACRDTERDGLVVRSARVTGLFGSAAASGTAGDDEGGCCEHRRCDEASARRSGCAHGTLLLFYARLRASADVRFDGRSATSGRHVFARGEIVVDHAVKLRPGGSADSDGLRSVRKAMSRRVEHVVGAAGEGPSPLNGTTPVRRSILPYARFAPARRRR